MDNLPTTPSLDLSTALEAFSISIHIERSNHRPYLRRNVRKGFLGMCWAFNIDCEPSLLPGGLLYVIYRLDIRSLDGGLEDAGDDDYLSEQDSWMCPICTTLGDRCLANRNMLEFHIWRDHSDVHSSWTKTSQGTTESVSLSLLCYRLCSHITFCWLQRWILSLGIPRISPGDDEYRQR